MANKTNLIQNRQVTIFALVLIVALATGAGLYFRFFSGAFSPADSDLNKDGVVNILDLSMLLSRYSTNDQTADINKDSKVDIFDLSILLSSYGSPVGGGTCSPVYGTFGAGNWPAACWRPYADTSPFNTQIPANPRIASGSSGWVSYINSGSCGGSSSCSHDLLFATAGSTSDYNHPIYYSKSSDPLYTINCLKYGGGCEIDGRQVHIPNGARPAQGGDGHMAIIDQSTNTEYDFWQVGGEGHILSSVSGGGTLNISYGGMTAASEGSHYGLGSDATAALFGLIAGIIRAPELEAGQINHALFLTIKCTNGGKVYPAEGLAAGCDGAAPPDGARVQLNMTDTEINALSAPAWKKAVLKAMAHYGAYVGDTGANNAWEMHIESGNTYTSFGYPDRVMNFFNSVGGGRSSGNYHYFDLESGVPWSRLRVIDPCVAQGTC